MDPPAAAGAGDDLADDFDSISFNSTTTTTTTATTAVDAKRSTSSGSSSSAVSKLHAPSSDPCWNAIRHRVRTKSSPRINGGDGACESDLALGDLHFVHRLGSGDIGSVYLVELKEPDGKKSSSVEHGCLFAAKVMDRKELASRNKETRARVEREILEMLDHPFLPTLYAAIETPMFSCLLTEFCPGGDLHVLRQRRPGKRFDEAAVRFYASEVIVALEYLHILGIIYRDLKPENVLVRSDGHIMLTDFDLSLKSDGTASISTDPTLDPSSTASSTGAAATSVAASCYYSSDPQSFSGSSCILPNCIVPAVSCFRPKRRRKKNSANGKYKFSSGGIGSGGGGPPEIIAEPVDVRSMSFVGTHEYLAPEIVSGEGHGSAVDWWTLGIFIFELFYGVTPFKGFDHELTLANIVARALEFPKEPSVPAAAKDLMTQLLVKDPARRMGSTAGSTVLKRHPFFAGVNWALLRCAAPPYMPRPVTSADFIRAADNGKDNDNNNNNNDNSVEYY